MRPAWVSGGVQISTKSILKFPDDFTLHLCINPERDQHPAGNRDNRAVEPLSGFFKFTGLKEHRRLVCLTAACCKEILYHIPNASCTFTGAKFHNKLRL